MLLKLSAKELNVVGISGLNKQNAIQVKKSINTINTINTARNS
jgi:hypothetical protein